jgi:hypothetical protein
MKKTKINFYSFDGLRISLEKRAKTNRRFCPYLVRKASGRPLEGERETSLRKELSTVIDEVSVGDRREPASRHAHACVEKSVSGAFEAQESDPRRKKNKISSLDGGPTSDPEIRHTPDFLILLSGGGIPGKRGVRGKKKKISFFGGRPVPLLRIRHPCGFLSFSSGGKDRRKWCSPVEKRNFFLRRDGCFFFEKVAPLTEFDSPWWVAKTREISPPRAGNKNLFLRWRGRFGSPKSRTPLDFCPSLVGGPDAKRRQKDER